MTIKNEINEVSGIFMWVSYVSMITLGIILFITFELGLFKYMLGLLPIHFISFVINISSLQSSEIKTIIPSSKVQIKAFLDKEKCKKVIDYGCGIQPISKDYINMDKKTHNIKKFWKGIKTNSMDAIVSFSVIEHQTPDEVHEFLLQSHRVLKKDGLLLIGTPEQPDRLFWSSLSHKRPYPSLGLTYYFKTYRDCVVDDYEPIDFRIIDTFYESKAFKGKRFIQGFANKISEIIPSFRREYLMILRCNK